MSDNWVVQNLENALETWNEKLSEIWTLITTTPQNFKGGNIWKVIVDINGAVQAIGLALLVLFFVIGMVKTCGSFTRTCCLLERDAVRSVRSVPIRMRPAVFQGKLFPQWKHMECWSCRCVRQIIWIIIMVQEKLSIPVVIY